MMLGVSGLAGNSTTHPAATNNGEDTAEAHEEGSGNRWPSQETMALLNIRSEMDATFRDSTLKAPLWEEVSRKMVELGYNRNAKKCRQKFENLYKYHKRTKEGRSSKSDGKTYKFFDQLAALENVIAPPSESSVQVLPPPSPPRQMVVHADPISVLPPAPGASPPSNVAASQQPHDEENYTLSLTSSSDEDDEKRQKRKRKEEEYFSEVMKGVIEKQEELQKKFLERLEKKEKERMIREEAWRNQETERIKREYDLLAQERSMLAKRHSTLVSFLEKMTHHYQKSPNSTCETNIDPLQPSSAGVTQPSLTTTTFPIFGNGANWTENKPSYLTVEQNIQRKYDGNTMMDNDICVVPQPILTSPPLLGSHPRLIMPLPVAAQISPPQDDDNVGESSMPTKTSSRWPKAEVEELIKIRTSLENKYQENGPKGPLWQEVSIEMSKVGYKRSSLRCKEKWENINKYFKRVKDNNKKRSEASKTCPYFHQLEVLYKEKAKGSGSSSNNNASPLHCATVKPDNPMIPIMALPEEDPGSEDVNFGFDELEGDGHACMNDKLG